jgi:hypothetical protein
MSTMRWVPGERGLGGFVDKAREMDLQNMSCVNYGCIDNSVILENRLIERSSICCTTH